MGRMLTFRSSDHGSTINLNLALLDFIHLRKIFHCTVIVSVNDTVR